MEKQIELFIYNGLKADRNEILSKLTRGNNLLIEAKANRLENTFSIAELEVIVESLSKQLREINNFENNITWGFCTDEIKVIIDKKEIYKPYTPTDTETKLKHYLIRGIQEKRKYILSSIDKGQLYLSKIDKGEKLNIALSKKEIDIKLYELFEKIEVLNILDNDISLDMAIGKIKIIQTKESIVNEQLQ